MIDPTSMMARCSSAFIARFGTPVEAVGAAPARVNLMGEHTDYNGGCVLPTVLAPTTTVFLARRGDGQAEVISIGPDEERRGVFQIGVEQRRGDFIDYPAGLGWALDRRGIRFSGYSAMVHSTIPMGSGLSSSAALLVALGRGLRSLFGLHFDDEALALAAHEAETGFVGAPVGVMDPIAVSLGYPRMAMMLDTRTLRREEIRLPEEAGLAIIHSGIAHRHQTGSYAARRAECESAAAALGVSFLTDLAADDTRMRKLSGVLARRARHVVTENARVGRAAASLRAGDLRHLGALFYESHASMRDDFEVSIPEIDALVDIARSQAHVLGARLTGGGFGGAIVVLTSADRTRDVAKAVVARARSSGSPDARMIDPGEDPS